MIDFSINGIYGDALLFWVFTDKVTPINYGGSPLYVGGIN